jgi:hypothetical protein
LAERPDLISASELQGIFSNMENIFEFNMALLKQLNDRLQNWTSDNPSEHLIGDLFLEAVCPIALVFFRFILFSIFQFFKKNFSDRFLNLPSTLCTAIILMELLGFSANKKRRRRSLRISWM